MGIRPAMLSVLLTTEDNYRTDLEILGVPFYEIAEELPIENANLGENRAFARFHNRRRYPAICGYFADLRSRFNVFSKVPCLKPGRKIRSESYIQSGFDAIHFFP